MKKFISTFTTAMVLTVALISSNAFAGETEGDLERDAQISAQGTHSPQAVQQEHTTKAAKSSPKAPTTKHHTSKKPAPVGSP